MKKAVVLFFAASFVFCLFHFYYAEDHCPIHCPVRTGGFHHVHPHHAGAAVCLCFWSNLMGPETCDLPVMSGSLSFLDCPGTDRVLGRPAADITPPPRSFLV